MGCTGEPLIRQQQQQKIINQKTEKYTNGINTQNK